MAGTKAEIKKILISLANKASFSGSDKTYITPYLEKIMKVINE